MMFHLKIPIKNHLNKMPYKKVKLSKPPKIPYKNKQQKTFFQHSKPPKLWKEFPKKNKTYFQAKTQALHPLRKQKKNP